MPGKSVGAGSVEEVAWVTHLSTLGASGAIIAMLGWILYQMPKHFAAERLARRKVAASHRKASRLLAEAHQRAVTAVLAAADKRDRYEREACERRHQELLEASDRRYDDMLKRLDEMIKKGDAEHTLIREVKHEVANLAQIQANMKAIEEFGKQQQKGATP